METCDTVFRRDVIRSVTLEEYRFGFDPGVTAKVAAIRGGRIHEGGISHARRTYEEGTKIGWCDGVRAIWCTRKYRRSAVPAVHPLRHRSGAAGPPAPTR